MEPNDRLLITDNRTMASEKTLKGLDAFADAKRLIVVAAHPDDLESMCGGTVALLAQRGVVVYSVNCTLGDLGTKDVAAGRAALDAYMPAKMPLYRPEQLNEPDANVGCLERIFVFATDREPEVSVDVTDIYETKLAACMAHRSQFPQGEESLEWMKEIDRGHGERIGVDYAEAFKEIGVW